MTTKQTGHTPKPWKYSSSGSKLRGYILDSKNDTIATLHSTKLDCLKANAVFIVTACNSHYELLEALRSILDEFAGIEEADLQKAEKNVIRTAKQAIAKVEGETR